MKVLFSLSARLPGFVLKVHVVLKEALTRFFDFVTCRDKDDDFPWGGIL